MKKSTNIVIILLFASLALQALAFAIPGMVSLPCRGVGALLLVMALLAALKGQH